MQKFKIFSGQRNSQFTGCLVQPLINPGPTLGWPISPNPIQKSKPQTQIQIQPKPIFKNETQPKLDEPKSNPKILPKSLLGLRIVDLLKWQYIFSAGVHASNSKNGSYPEIARFQFRNNFGITPFLFFYRRTALRVAGCCKRSFLLKAKLMLFNWYFFLVAGYNWTWRR